MKAQETIDLGDGHQIEIGKATWDETQTSVRNRYLDSTQNVNSRRSSEIALADLSPIFKVIAERDLLDVATTTELIQTLAASLARRTATAAPTSLEELLTGVTKENCHAEVETGEAVGKELW